MLAAFLAARPMTTTFSTSSMSDSSSASNPGLIHLREITQVYTFRRIPVHLSHDILVNLLCHKRNHGSSRLCHGHKGRVQGHEGINLILLHSLCPEAVRGFFLHTSCSYRPRSPAMLLLPPESCSFQDCHLLL